MKQTVDYGVELTGWTEPDGMRNVEGLKSIAQLQKLKNAIDCGQCVWVALADEEWDARKEAYKQATATKPTNKRKQKGKKKAQRDHTESDDEDEDEDEDDVTSRDLDTSAIEDLGFAASLQPPIIPTFPMIPMPSVVPTFPTFPMPGMNLDSGLDFAPGNSMGYQGWW